MLHRQLGQFPRAPSPYGKNTLEDQVRSFTNCLGIITKVFLKEPLPSAAEKRQGNLKYLLISAKTNRRQCKALA